MAKKLYPVETSVALNSSSDTSGEHPAMLEIAPVLSRMNHRLYRQSRVYSFKLQNVQRVGTSDTRLEIYTLPNNWFVYGAIKYAFDTYMQNHADELANGVKFSRWHDFECSVQNPDGDYEFLEGVLWDGDGFGTMAADEPTGSAGVYSTTKAADGTSMGFHVMGNIANSYNIFREYAELLNNRKPDDESTTAVQPYGELLDLKDAEQMVEHGDRAPYDRDFSGWIPDDETVDDSTGQHILTLQDVLTNDPDGGGGRQTSKVIHAPLGLVWIRNFVGGTATDLSTSNTQLRLEVSKGGYKGVKAPSLV